MPGRGQSYWVGSTPGTDYPQPEENASVDVAVLGGGIAGIVIHAPTVINLPEEADKHNK